MPTNLNDISVTVNGLPAYIYFYCSSATNRDCPADQINILTRAESAQSLPSRRPREVITRSSSRPR
jgi:hypothetical protein